MGTLSVTLVAKLKHGALYAAAKRLGGQSALARHCGVSVSEMCAWCNLRRVPSPTWPQKRLDELEAKLFAVTGYTLAELFPQDLRDAPQFLRLPKTIELTREVDTGILLAPGAHRLLLPSPADECAENDLRGQLRRGLRDALNQLSLRERQVIKLRFGLDGEEARDLKTTGEILGISRERVRQLEVVAVRRLQRDRRLDRLDRLRRTQ